MTFDPTTVTFRDPGDIIAAVPAMLGFIPERSLVLMTFTDADSRVGVTMRHDIDLGVDGEPTPLMCEVIDHLCAVCRRERVTAVFAIIVDDRAAPDSPVWELIFDLVDASLSDAGCGVVSDHAVGLGAGFVTAAITAGGRWHTGWGHRDRHRAGGRLDDPRSTPMAVAQAVTAGRVVLRSRSEMSAVVAPRPHCDEVICTAHIAPVVPLLSVVGAADDVVAAVYDADRATDERDATRLRTVVGAVADGLGPHPSCAQVSALEEALDGVVVRDAALALSSSVQADAAGVLWADLTRRLRGRGRAVAATLLAHLHYLAGDGAMAGVALDAALQADPTHSLAVLLDRSLRAGMRPDTVAELLPTSRATAHRLGVALPPMRRSLGRGA